MPVLAALSIAWSLSAPNVARSCAAALAERGARVRAIERPAGPRTFESTVLPLENADADARDALTPIVFLARVSPDDGVRAASKACAALRSSHDEIDYANPQLFAALAAVAQRGDAGAAEIRLTAVWLSRLRYAGGSLGAAQRSELLAVEAQLDAARAQFLANLASRSSAVIPARRLGGLSPELLALGTRAPGGAYAFPVDCTTERFLAEASSPEARESYYVAADQGIASNVDLLQRTLALRDRAAHLLGFETWAALVLAGTPFESEAGVEKFALETSSALDPAVRADVDAMQKAVRDDQHDARYGLRPWDVERARFLLDKSVAPAATTVAQALGNVSALYGVAFVPVVPADAWAPNVLEYRVVDAATRRERGLAYLDLQARPGKCPSPEAVTILPRRDGVRRPAAVAILAGWTPGSQEALDAQRAAGLYRALGSALATLLSDAPYASLEPEPGGGTDIAGIVTARFARAAPPPMAAYDAARDIALSRIELRYGAPGPRIDTTAVWRDAMQTALPDSYVAGTHPQAAFAPFIDDGGAAVFLRPWDAVYARDLMRAFGDALSPDPAAGMRFRTDVIAPARTQTLDDEMQAFLGREPSPQAFFDDLGVSPP